MEIKLLLALPEEFEVESLNLMEKTLLIDTVSTQKNPCCPLCGTPASRVHSRYMRRVADVPSGGQCVRLILHVRKFFCDETACARKIFTERLASLVEPWARSTVRLSQMVESIGLATGGKPGERLADRLGIATSWMSILRLIMALPARPVEQVFELGIDDFAFRRGRKFGTILVDMQSHQVLDLLPDRQADTAKAWMKVHPEIRVVSRDRGGDYAAGAREGAPQATQIADRFHLYKNLVEAVELTLARCRAELRKEAQKASHQDQEEVSKPLIMPTEPVSLENWKPAPDPCAERDRLSRRAQRYDRYQQVVALREQGLGWTEISRRVGLSRRTIERWLKEETFPEAKRRRKRRSSFDPYAAYVLKRWEQGCQNGLQLYQEIKEQGFPGAANTVYRFLVPLRRKERIIQKAEVPDAPLQDFSAHDAVWLFARKPADLDVQEQATLTAICQASETESRDV